MSFYNQSEHELFDRALVETWLESMETAALTEIASENHEGGDFDELLEACDSNFERTVLHVIRDEGFTLPDEAQHVIYDGDEPVAKPDFFYDRAGTAVAVFVDGPAHEKDYVKEDDERKRSRLKRMGYRVISVTDESQVPKIWETI